MIPKGIPQHPVKTTDKKFSELGLSHSIVAAVQKIGFVHPTPIQAAVIPVAMAGRDVIGLAETGSGKTAAFALPIAERLTHGRGLRGLILSPTREIALQTKAFLDIFGADHALEVLALEGKRDLGIVDPRPGELPIQSHREWRQCIHRADRGPSRYRRRARSVRRADPPPGWNGGPS